VLTVFSKFLKAETTHNIPCCAMLCCAGAELEFQALTGKVLEVPPNATAASHLRNGKFVLILRGTKGSSTAAEAQEKAEKGNHLGPVCSSTQDVIIGSANATRMIQELGQYVPSVKAYINFRDTGGCGRASFMQGEHSFHRVVHREW
jgi:hypothetical protein